MATRVVVGVDGGGSHTRVAVLDLRGALLSYAEGGAASLRKDELAPQNVSQAIRRAVEGAGCGLHEVAALTAGIAGLDSEADVERVSGLTVLPGLDCPREHVNDALVAHVGAFVFEPGIVAISGTGSIVFGVNERGREITNYQFRHYAATAARFLSYEAVFRIIAKDTDDTDLALVGQVLRHFAVEDAASLAALVAEASFGDRRARDRAFGDMAPLVTRAAGQGSGAALSICRAAASALATGIGLVGTTFESKAVAVALVGSVARSAPIGGFLLGILGRKTDPSYCVVEPSLPPPIGAALMALRSTGAVVTAEMVAGLKAQVAAGLATG